VREIRAALGGREALRAAIGAAIRPEKSVQRIEKAQNRSGQSASFWEPAIPEAPERP